jgi:hypothetical protein
MQKKAPGWGKAIGIIMICLGGLGIFIHIYKMLIPSLFGNMPRMMNDLSRLDHNNPAGDIMINEFNNMLGLSSTQSAMLMTFGILCLGLTVFYIIGGAKLLTATPSNYRFAKGALIAFIALNAIGVSYFYLGNTGFIVKAILIYSIVGLVFDITLLIILNASNKADYGIGVDDSLEPYSNYGDDEELI